MKSGQTTSTLDLDGISADEAFAILGNEIRLDIVRVLWHEDATYRYDDVTDVVRTISFSELRRRVDVDDNGRFNYHLSQLVPHFVRQDDDGYRLSGAGQIVARTVIAVSGEESVDFSADLDQHCPLCDESLRATYEDQWFRVECTECDGLFGDRAPDGAIYFTSHPAAGVSDRTPEEALATSFYRCMLDIAYMMRDVCRACAGRLSALVWACEAHETDGRTPCATCGTRFPVWAELRCDRCGYAKRLPVEAFVLGLTPVIGFLDERGFDALAPSFDEVVALLRSSFETTVEQEPFRVVVTIDGGAESLTVSLDDDLNVVDVDRPGSS